MAQDIAIKIDNRYEVLGELGRGGMGIVYKANDLKMDRLVAIKVMTAPAPGREEYQERFLREARSIARMQHPNIVVLYDYGYHAGAPYMAMEYVEGVPLDKVIASRVSLTPLAKVNFIVQVCQALQYAHQQGIVHRDVKPGNIMVLDGGKRVKLLDFGIARAGGASNLSKSGLAMGTICYMSPEQTKGQKDLDSRADVFSAGVVLYELIAGKPPWTGDSDYEIMTKIIHDPFPPLSGLRNYPQALDHIFECALAKDRNVRYPTAEKMAQELSELETPLKEQALEEALIQFENGDLLRARDLVSQILRIDTRHREAIELQGKLQQVAQLQERSDQVRQLRIAAEEAIGQKRYTEALSAVEQAITLDSANTELFHYRELIRHEVKRREDIRKKLELAKRAQEINDLSTAEELVDKALEVDPTDTQARMMKSSLEQEKKRQQQQEIAEEASRALAVRAFTRAREYIQQLEALDPDSLPLASLKKELVDGEAEDKRRIEIENLIRDIRHVLESGDVPQSLSVTEQALARFPGEARLVRLRTQAEALRDAAQRERTIQEHLALVKKLADEGQNAKALAAAEGALKGLGIDYRLQALITQLRQAVERERHAQAEQVTLAQARSALQASDFESALKILSAARIDFPNSSEVADAWQAAQVGLAGKAEAAERERQAQAEQALLAQARSAMQAANFESAVKILSAARMEFPSSKEVAAALQAAQAARAQKAEAVERERRVQAEQSALVQARSAMKASDFESALRVLTVARIDSPNSKELAEALHAAQAAIARKTELDAENARRREIVEALERTLASEPDPELQVRLAEEAVRRIPGNEPAERVLARVRERLRQISSAVERAQKFEQTERYKESIREWERVKQLWPQNPQIDAQIARLKADQKAAAAPKPPAPAPGFSATSIIPAIPKTAPAVQPPPEVKPPVPATGSSATSIMAAAPKTAPAAVPPVQPAVEAKPTPAPRSSATSMMAAAPKMAPAPHVQASPAPVEPAPAEEAVSSAQGKVKAQESSTLGDRSLPGLLQSKKLLLGIGAAAIVLITVLAIVLSHKSTPKQPVANIPAPAPAPASKSEPSTPVLPRPEVGTLTIKSNVDQVDVFVDGELKTVTDGRTKTLSIVPGSHKIALQKPGYAASPQQVEIAKDREATLQFTLTKSEDSSQPVADTYLMIQAPAGTKVRIDRRNEGEVRADKSLSVKTTPGRHEIQLALEGFQPWSETVTAQPGDRVPVIAELKAIPKPPPTILSFNANSYSIQQGQQVQLQWETQYATDVRIEPDIGPVPAKGATTVTLNENKTYVLKATGEGNPVQKNITISVTAIPKPVITSFEAGARKIPQGESVKLLWSAQNATEGFITPDVGKVSAQGSLDVTPVKNTTYNLIVKGPGGTSEQRTVQVLVESAPPATTAAAPSQPTTPPSADEDPEIKGVNEALDRYRAAYSSMSADELRKAWPKMSKKQQEAIHDLFNDSSLKAVNVTLNCSKRTISGETAQTTCKQVFAFTRNGKVEKSDPHNVVISLQKNGGTWQIADVAGK